MDHKKVLKRAWNILWAYKALWVFGLILALVAGGMPRNGGDGRNNIQLNDGNGGQSEWTTQDFLRSVREQFGQAGQELSRFLEDTVIPNSQPWLIGMAVVLGILILLAIVVSTFLRYISEMALIRMVDDYETQGVKVTVGKGFALGWSRSAWRMFLIDLVIDIPVTLIFILLLAIAISPLFLWATEINALGVLGTIAAIGLFFLWIFMAIIVSIALSLLKPFFRRACAIENMGVIPSIRRGFSIVRLHLKDAVLMGLILFGIGLVYGICLFFVMLILGALGLVAGGLVGVTVGLLTAIGSNGLAPWVFGAIFGGLALGVVIGIPLWFVNGLWTTYQSSTWTLTYRELAVVDTIKEEEAVLIEPEIPDAA